MKLLNNDVYVTDLPLWALFISPQTPFERDLKYLVHLESATGSQKFQIGNGEKVLTSRKARKVGKN